MDRDKLKPETLDRLKLIITKYKSSVKNSLDFSDEEIEQAWEKIPTDELGRHPTTRRPLKHIFYHTDVYREVIKELAEEIEKKVFNFLLKYLYLNKTKEDSSQSSNDKRKKSDEKDGKLCNEPDGSEVDASNLQQIKGGDDVDKKASLTTDEKILDLRGTLPRVSEAKRTLPQSDDETVENLIRGIDNDETDKPSSIPSETATFEPQQEISVSEPTTPVEPVTTQLDSDLLVPPPVETEPYILKNGKVGQEYSEILDFSRICSTGENCKYTIDGLSQIGLELDEDAGEIKGVPKVAGDPGENFEFVLTLRYQKDEKTIGKRELSIKILPDPRSLWKEIEPAEELEDRKDHMDSDFKEIGKDKNGKPRFIVAASKRGRAHAHKGTFRDDHTKIKYLRDDGWSIITVADGAGSAKLSRVGSKIACETAVNYITKKLIDFKDDLNEKIQAAKNSNENNAVDHELKVLLYNIVAAAGLKARKEIKAEKERRQESINQFHTTLVIGIHKVFDFGNFFAGFWIGDGALALYDKDANKIDLLGIPDAGEYSGQTKFLTEQRNWTEDAKPFARVQYRICDDFTAFFAMSDGITDAKFPTESNLGEIAYWDKLWKELEIEDIKSENNVDQKLLAWLDFWAEGEHDDRTVAILF